MEEYTSYLSILGIFLTVVSIGISWWALQAFRFDVLTKDAKSPQSLALQIILSVIIGYHLARFLLDYLLWSITLKTLF